MSPLLKRILLHGGITAIVLAGVGLLFSRMAGMWMAGPGGTGPQPVAEEELRYSVPLTMAFWGFVFVVVCEVIISRVRPTPSAEAKTAEKQPDDAEKLLNELLAQAESRMAEEQKSEGTNDKGQEEAKKAGGSPPPGTQA